jgi:hypothetical protein
MRRLLGACLIVIGPCASGLAIWWTMNEHPDAFKMSYGAPGSASALGGLILSGLICTFVGFVLLVAPRAGR